MLFTVTGIIIMAVGIILFIFSNKWLFAFTIFFVPFTATAVFNIGSTNNASAIQPYMFLSVLFILKNIPTFAARFSKPNHSIRYKKNFSLLFAIFVFIALVSLIMPIIIDGTINGNLSGKLDEYLPIEFTVKNITQFLYFLLGYIFSIFVAQYISRTNSLFFAIKTLAYSTLFVIGWGMMEFFFKKLSIPYPAEIFNNSLNSAAAGYNELLDNGLDRISSVASEPSILTQNIIVFLPFLLVGIEQKKYLFSLLYDYLFIGLIITFILLTTSSSGIISILILFILFFLTKEQSVYKKVVTIVLSLIMIGLGSVLVYFVFTDIIKEAILNKAGSYSAAERLGTITSGWKNFLEYPILGVGWGSVTVNDLFIRILATTGITGFIFMCLSIYNVIKYNSYMSLKYKGVHELRYYNRACLLSFCILLINCEIAGFVFYYGTFWLILGLTVVRPTKLLSNSTI